MGQAASTRVKQSKSRQIVANAETAVSSRFKYSAMGLHFRPNVCHAGGDAAVDSAQTKKRTLKRLPSEGVGEGGPGSRNRLVGKLRHVRDRAAHRGLV